MFINELPSEILRNIFELAVGKESRLAPSHPKPTSPQTLCSVCRTWRAMVLQNPLLWNTLHFGPSEEAILQTGRLLQRSANAPVDIHLTTVYKHQTIGGFKNFRRYGARFLNLIESESHRWRTLELRMPDPELVTEVRPIWNGQAPMLEKLVLSCRERQSVQSIWLQPNAHPSQSPPTLLTGSDNLTSLTISGFTVRWDQWNCRSVTQLSLGPFASTNPGPNRGELCGILSILADRLISLGINGLWGISHDASVFQGPVVFKSLTSLCIFRWERITEDLLLGCSFPILESFEMAVPFALPASNIVSLFCDEPRLFHSIKCLIVHVFGETRAPLLDVLQRAFAQVNHIELSQLSTVDSVASGFIASWVSLTRLDIREASLPEVKEILLRRKQSYPTPLQEVSLWIALGFLNRTDYELILSHVDRFTISQVRPRVDKTSPWDLWKFEDKYLIDPTSTRRK